MKKHGVLISFLLISSLLSSSNSLTALAFSDVTSSTPHAQAIDYLQAQHIIDGLPDGSFKPNLYVNRAEALKMIMGATSPTIPEVTSSGFPDVAATDWFAKYVSLAKDKNILSGYPDGTFKGAELINYGEILKMLFRSYGVVTTNSYSESTLRVNFPGTTGKEWYLPYMMYAKEKNMLILANPGVYPSRAEIAETLYRMMLIERYQLKKFEETNVPLLLSYENAQRNENKIIESALTSTDKSPLLNGTSLTMTAPLLLEKDLLGKKEKILSTLGEMINEADLIHSIMNEKVASSGIETSSYETLIVSIKNSLTSLKNQLINKAAAFTDEERLSFLSEMLLQRKNIVKLYAALELAEAKQFITQKLLLIPFANYTSEAEYQNLVSKYQLTEDTVSSAEKKLGEMTLYTDEFTVYNDVVTALGEYKKTAKSISQLAEDFLKKIVQN